MTDFQAAWFVFGACVGVWLYCIYRTFKGGGPNWGWFYAHNVMACAVVASSFLIPMAAGAYS